MPLPSLPAASSPLILFALGYLVCLATPGPNFVMIAGIALLRGWRSCLPVCLGVSVGSICLLLLIYGFVDLLPDAALVDRMARAVSGVLFLYIAWRTFRTRLTFELSAPTSSDFGLGFWTAFLNPTTGTFFIGHFLAYKSTASFDHAAAALALVVTISLVRSGLIAAAFGVWRVKAAGGLLARAVTWVAGGLMAAFGGLSLASLVH